MFSFVPCLFYDTLPPVSLPFPSYSHILLFPVHLLVSSSVVADSLLGTGAHGASYPSCSHVVSPVHVDVLRSPIYVFPLFDAHIQLQPVIHSLELYFSIFHRVTLHEPQDLTLAAFLHLISLPEIPCALYDCIPSLSIRAFLNTVFDSHHFFL